MPSWLKVVLIVLAVGVVLCGAGVGAVVWWFDSNKASFKAKGDRAKADGEAFAKTTDSLGCVQKSLERLKADSSFMDEIEIRVFLAECLKAAPKTKDFCHDVPKQSEFIAAAGWAQSACADYDGPLEPCGRLMQEVIKQCDDAAK